MSRIVYDVTQLAHWTGKITGIPRVIDELAKRFASLEDHEVVFAVWVKDLQEMCVIDFDQTITQRGGLVYKQVGDQLGYVQHPSKSKPKTSAQLSSVPRRSLVKRVAKKGLRVSQKFSPSLGAKLETQAKQLHMKSYLQVDFQKGDLFVIPWGEW
ncbi:MAG: hypothetical protein ACQR33_03735, partial [Candidatus Saccharibacteria bacterium]